MLYTILRVLLLTAAMSVLTACCIQDLRDKEYSIIFVPVMFVLAAANSVLTGKPVTDLVSSAAVLVILGTLSLVSGQKLGLGDVFILSALVLFRGFASGVFIFNTSLVLCLMFCIFKSILSDVKKTTETAFVPFILIGFVMSYF